MSRETFVVLCAAAAAMSGCQSSKEKISGRIVGTEPRNIYLEEVTPLRPPNVDSTVLAASGSIAAAQRAAREQTEAHKVEQRVREKENGDVHPVRRFAEHPAERVEEHGDREQTEQNGRGLGGKADVRRC